MLNIALKRNLYPLNDLLEPKDKMWITEKFDDVSFCKLTIYLSSLFNQNNPTAVWLPLPGMHNYKTLFMKIH